MFYHGYAAYDILLCSGGRRRKTDDAHIIATVPAGTNTYTDVNKGEADTTYWWYVVRARDTSDNLETNTNAVQEPS